jgi:hypothetical protein
MSSKTAFSHLAVYCEEKTVDPRCQKALKAIENDATLRAKLAEQVAFDRQMVELVRAIRAPQDLRTRLENTQKAVAKEKRSREALVAIMAVVLGIALMAGLFIYSEMESRKAFPGRDALEGLVASANQMSGVELEPVAQPAGQLADWFYMRGFENFAVPPELRTMPAVGSRFFRKDGCPVAQIAVDMHESLLYIMRAKDFGVELPADGAWRIFETEGWAAAALQSDGDCVMVTFRGTEAEMSDFIERLKKS